MQFIEKIVKEICDENDIKFEEFCDGFCIRLSKNNKLTYIYDSIFEENSSSTYKILKDKSAVYEILSHENIPAVEHFYFYPQKDKYDDFFVTANALLKKYNKLVLKYNEGMSGNNVFLVDNEKTLKLKAMQIINKYNSITISPFYEIKHEYRVIFLNNKARLIFDKVRPFVVGNGIDTIEQLIKQKFKNKIKPDDSIDVKSIPKNGETVLLSWRHNLNFGANPEELNNEKTFKILKKIAQDSAKTLKIKFASIDIVETDENQFKVLEINGSVTTEKFASFSNQNYEKVKSIYKEVVFELLK